MTTETTEKVVRPKAAKTRRGVRSGRAFALAIALVVVAAAFSAGYAVLLRAHPAAGAGPAGEGLPTSVVAPPGWTADVRNATVDSALVAFVSDDSDDGATLTVVGTGDQYRTYDPPVSGRFLLSPDGGELLMPGSSGGDKPWFTEVQDIGDGAVRQLDGAALALSPDGAQVAVLAGTPDGDQGEIRLVELSSRAVSLRVPVTGTRMRTTIAIAPDGSALAVQLGDQLAVYSASGKVWQQELTGQNLAGPAAWTPDGQSLAVASYTGKVTFVDAATGGHSTDPGLASMPGRPVFQGTSARIIAWRDGAPIVVTDTRLIELSAVPRTLLSAPDTTSGLAVATDRLALQARQPGTPQPGPLLQRFRLLVLVAALVLVALAIVAAVVGVVRRPKPAPKPQPLPSHLQAD